MKKVLLVVAMAGFMISCKDKKEEKKAEETTTTTPPPTTTEPTTTEPSKMEASSGVPTFSDADVNAYVAAYEEYVNTYKKAV